ncbi:MAG: hypothetical protein ACTHZ9_13140 [Leucobacter sp.]|uniref:hypothetical protein n=1 Tax=Microbacterium gubbeenense TaxID=159896 RepID=UPI00040CC1C6|nr:hypothetical protein [Microbacterium gubbeenense]
MTAHDQNPRLAAALASIRPALNAQPTTEAERAQFLYDLTREVYDHVKFDLHMPTADTAERTRVGDVVNAALPIIGLRDHDAL